MSSSNASDTSDVSRGTTITGASIAMSNRIAADGDVDDGTGCVVPLGEVIKTKVDGKPIGKTSVNVNEFIVYDVSQVRMRYLLRLKMNEEE